MPGGVGDGLSQHQRELSRQGLRHLCIEWYNRDRRCTVPVPCRFFQLPLHIAAASGQEVREMEIDLLLADGTVVNMLSYAAPLFDEHGQVICRLPDALQRDPEA